MGKSVKIELHPKTSRHRIVMNISLSTSRRNTIYILLVLSYFFSYFFRVSTSVVLPLVQTEWFLEPAFIGFISSMYFYTYALMQPLCGVLNDKIGPTKVVAFGIIFTAVGSLCFALATTPATLIVGRLLMGIGLSPMLSGVLVFQKSWFSSEKYTFLTSITLMTGNMGAVFSVAPLSYAMNTWGRKTIFCILSAATLLIAVFLFYFGRKTLSDKANFKTDQKVPLLRQLSTAMHSIKKSNNILRILIIWTVCLGSLMAFQGLWVFAWFAKVYPHSMRTSLAATIVGIGVVVGNIISGHVCKKTANRHRFIRLMVCLNAFAWFLTVCALTLPLSIELAAIISGILGITSGICFVQFTTAVNELSPEGQSGAIFGIINALIFFGILFFQWGSGFLLDVFANPQNPTTAFSSSFAIIVLSMLIPCITCFFLRPFKTIISIK